MHAIDIRFHAVLAELIKEQRNREAQHLVDGKAQDWGDYQKRVGILEGLQRALQLADQLADDTKGRERQVAMMLTTEEG